jgi:DNA-binding SARP family transcriptional activator
LLEAAVAVYGGPFLDGFFLKESPEFEEWAERQRRTLARRYLDALSTLAARAAAQGDFARAASWRQRAAETDPLDSDVALALVQALAESGDRAGAVRAAREYQGKIQAELGLSPDPRVTALLARLA